MLYPYNYFWMKISPINLILFLCLPTFGQQAFTPVKDFSFLANKIEKHSLSIQTIDSDFKQEKYLSSMSSKFLSEGKFLFKKEKKVRWEYLKPIVYTIVIQGNTVQLKDEYKVSSYDMNADKSFRQANDLLLKVVQGTIFNDKEHNYQFLESNQSYKVVLTPISKKPSNMFSSIEMFLNKTTYDVTGLTLKESQGDYIKITFENRKINQIIDDSRFTLR